MPFLASSFYVCYTLDMQHMTFGTSSIGFDPADSAQYAAEAAPILGGPPGGQDRY